MCNLIEYLFIYIHVNANLCIREHGEIRKYMHAWLERIYRILLVKQHRANNYMSSFISGFNWL